MKILFVHAYYQQYGGEDRSIEAEARDLEERGHEIRWLTFDNAELETWSTARTAVALQWNRTAYRDALAQIRSFGPDIVHVQNLFPALSPSVYWAAAAEGVPVVQKLSNYRIFCVNGLLFRDGAVCEKCLGRSVALSGIRHGCFRGSRLKSAGIAATFATQRLLGTWNRRIAAYIALDPDGRDRFIAAGLDPARVHLKSEVLESIPPPGAGEGGYALFAGRLSPEKGVDVMLDAWSDDPSAPPLRIAGDGPLAPMVREADARDPRITWLGRLDTDRLAEELANARVAIVPSRFYETFGRAALEPMVYGTPVAAARLGALRNVVRDGVSGRHFEPGDSRGLSRAIESIFNDPAGAAAVRERTRADAIERYHPDRSYEALLGIYDAAINPR